MLWEVIAPMIMLIVLILTTGGVILLRPLTKQLGALLEAMAQERRDPGLKEELVRMRELNEIMSERLALLEERQEFTENLLKSPERQKLKGGD